MKAAFLTLRKVIYITSSISYTVIGYASPVLSAIEIIHNEDELSEAIRMIKIKECLMYWSVIIISGYFERIIYYLYLLLYFKNMPELPIEIRLLYIIWLLNYGGVNMLHKYVISPLFKDFESIIDDTINYIISQLQQKINRHIQHIVWQILFAPEEGMISGNLRQIMLFLYNLKSKLNSKQNNHVNHNLNQTIESKNTVIFSSSSSSTFSSSSSSSLFSTSSSASSSSTLTSQSLGKLLLVEFTHLMTEGIELEAGTTTSSSSAHTSSSSSLSSSLHPCKLSLIRKGFTVQIESHNSKHKRPSVITTSSTAIATTESSAVSSTRSTRSMAKTNMKVHDMNGDKKMNDEAYNHICISFPLVCVVDICAYTSDNMEMNFDDDANDDVHYDNHDHIVLVKYTIPSSSSSSSSKSYDSKTNLLTDDTYHSNTNTDHHHHHQKRYQPQQQSILLMSEDSEEADSLLTGLQILATSCRGKFMRKLARMSRIFDIYWTRKAFNQLSSLSSSSSSSSSSRRDERFYHK